MKVFAVCQYRTEQSINEKTLPYSNPLNFTHRIKVNFPIDVKYMPQIGKDNIKTIERRSDKWMSHLNILKQMA